MQLPLEQNPPVRTYNFNAYALGAALSNGRDLTGFLRNGFIQLAAPAQRHSGDPMLLFIPHIGPTTFQQAGLGVQTTFAPRSPNDLVSALATSLARGFYVRLLVDEYYIPERRPFQLRHNEHDILVYGCSEDRSTFDVIGYTANRRYRATTCPTKAIVQGFLGRPQARSQGAPFIAFSPYPKVSFPLSIETIEHQLRAFLLGRPTDDSPANRPFVSAAYGVMALHVVGEKLARMAASGKRWDPRPFCVIAEHAKGMRERAVAVANVGRRTSSAMRAVHEYEVFAENARLMALAVWQNHDFRLREQMLGIWQSVAEKAVSGVKSLLSQIENGQLP